MEQAKQAHHEKKQESIKKPESIEKSIDKILYVLIAIAVLAVLAIIFIPNLNPFSNKIIYTSPDGEKFEIIKGQIGKVPIYTFRITVLYGRNLLKPYEIPLRNQPKTLKDISIDKSVKTKILNSKGIFITMDPELPEATNMSASIAGIQLAKVIGTADYGVFKIPTQGAFTKPINTTNSSDYPVKTCQDAAQEIRIIYLKLGNETRAYTQGECIIVEAKTPDDLIKAAEKTVLNILNIM